MGIASNATAGRNAAQVNLAEQNNFARRIVALRVFADVRQSVKIRDVQRAGYLWAGTFHLQSQ